MSCRYLRVYRERSNSKTYNYTRFIQWQEPFGVNYSCFNQNIITLDNTLPLVQSLSPSIGSCDVSSLLTFELKPSLNYLGDFSSVIKARLNHSDRHCIVQTK